MISLSPQQAASSNVTPFPLSERTTALDDDDVNWLADCLLVIAEQRIWTREQWLAMQRRIMINAAPGMPWHGEAFALAALRVCRKAVMHA